MIAIPQNAALQFLLTIGLLVSLPNDSGATDPFERIDSATLQYSVGNPPPQQDPEARINAADEFYEARLAQFTREREELRNRSQELFDRLESAQEVQDWAQEQAPDLRAPPKELMKKQPRMITHWQRVRQVSAHQFLDFPAIYSAGAIRSGRALNFFLDSIGDVALQHERFLTRAHGRGLAALTAEEKERLAVLDQIDSEVQIPPRHLREIYCEYGLTNPKMLIRLSSDDVPTAEALPLRWPTFFLLNREFETHLSGVEESRAEALAEIQEGKLMGPGQRKLMRRIDDLETEFRALERTLHRESFARAQYNSRLRPGASRVSAELGQKDYEVCNARSFLSTLKSSLSRLIETRYLDAAAFQSRRGRTTVVDLLAHMKQNGLRFAKATPDAEASYQFLFERMVDYYDHLFSIRVACEDAAYALEDEKALTDRQIQESIEFERAFIVEKVRLENGVDTSKYYAQRNSRLVDWIQAGVDAVGVWVQWQDLKDRRDGRNRP